MIADITICACWDGSKYYSVDYINILYDSIKRNTSKKFDFVLYVGPLAKLNFQTPKINSAIKIIQTDLPYWWCGMPAWSRNPPGTETNSILYMDLDQVIIGNLDEIIDYPSDYCMMRDNPSFATPKGLEKNGNATITLIRNGAGHVVWEKYIEGGMPQWNPLNPPIGRKFPLAAQGISNEFLKCDLFPDNLIISYKKYYLKKGIPEGCKSISFHGKPKPHECLRETFVKENWLLKHP